MKKAILSIIILFCAVIFLTGCGAAKAPVEQAPIVKKGIPRETVAEHNLPSDCWLIINNNIYNITDYVANHPGGEKNITDYCGQDATAAFDTKNEKPGETHSDAARALLQKFYIGDLAR
jgi:cytochrome b involved in lipid metabolism